MSRSPFLTVLALGLGALPYLLTAFIGGVLADRVDRARLMASIYCAKALVYALIWEMWDQDKTDWYIRLDARRFCVDWRPAQVCCQGGKAETGP